MKRYVETKWLFFTFEEEEEFHTEERKGMVVENQYSWRVKNSSVEEALTKLAVFCDANAYEVKGILPVTRAQALSMMAVHFGQRSSVGAGSGWGIEMIIGFIAIVQRIEDLNEEMFNRRVKARALREQKEELMKMTTDAQREMKEIQTALTDLEETINQGIVETQKGTFRKKMIYKVGEKEFENRFHAEAYIRDLEKQKEDAQSKILSLHQHIEQLNDEVVEINTQIRRLEV